MVRRWLERLAALSDGAARGLLVLVFVVSRLAFFAAGGRFETELAGRGWQFLDLALLQHRLAESLFYLHSQPPLFNLVLGLVVKAAPEHYALVLQVLYLAMGLATCQLLYALMRRLGVSPPLGLVLVVGFGVSPSFILYEQWLFYTLPLASLLVASAWALVRALDGGGDRWWAALFAAAFALCGVQSLFHLLYFVLVTLLVVAFQRGSAARALRWAAVPSLLIVALYTKNAVVFGQFAASSWLGMNLAVNRIDSVALEEREQMVADGEVSALVLAEPFLPLERYPAVYTRVPAEYADVPALAALRKSTCCELDQQPHNNYNHWGYLAVSRQYASDLGVLFAHDPLAMALGATTGWFLYFHSSSDVPHFAAAVARAPLVGVEAWLYDYGVYGRHPGTDLCVWLLMGIPAVLWSGLRAGLGRGPHKLDATQRNLLLFLSFNVLYVAVLGNALNGTENNRLRFVTDPLLLVLLASALQRLLPAGASGARGSFDEGQLGG